jgi:hypothetical protein
VEFLAAKVVVSHNEEKGDCLAVEHRVVLESDEVAMARIAVVNPQFVQMEYEFFAAIDTHAKKKHKAYPSAVIKVECDEASPMLIGTSSCLVQIRSSMLVVCSVCQ